MGLLEYTLRDQEQLCFVHIPKTAGTTLISLLDAHFPTDGICPAQLWRDLVWLPQDSLPRYQLLRGHYTYDDYLKLVPNPVFISMLRNPIARSCSYYNFMRNQSDDWLERHYGYRDALAGSHPQVAALVEQDIEIYQRANQDDLPTFFASPFVQNWIENWQVRAIAQSFVDPAPLGEDAMLERAKERLETLVWFGLVERFTDSMALLTYTFGWNPIRQYQRLMVAPNPNYTEGLPAQTIETLQAIHQLDLALYDYAAELLTQRYESMQQQLQERYGASSPAGTDEVFVRLEMHYRDRTQALSLPQQTVIDLKFDQAIAGTGWHLREGDAEGRSLFRWTGPEIQSTLALPLAPGQDFTLKLRVVGAVSEEVLESLRVSVGDVDIPLTMLCHDVRPGVYLVLLEGVVPAKAIDSDSPFTRLTFSVCETRSLHSLDTSNPDRRPVGVALDWISLFPHAEIGDEGYRYMLFLGDDPAWVVVARWLRSHLHEIHQIIAPLEFAEVLPNRVLPYAVASGQQSLEADWIVFHKGMLDALPVWILDEVVALWQPVYADSVFVVFTKRPDVEAIAPGNADLHAFHLSYITLFNSREFVEESPDAPEAKLSNDEYRSMLFPTDDPAWDAAARTLQLHRNRIAQVIAPSEFAEVLPNRVLSYDAVPEQPLNADWIVVHKGRVDVFPLALLDEVVTSWTPAYANSVFVIFTKRSDVEAIAPDNADLHSFRTDYVARFNAEETGEDYRYLLFPALDPAWDAVARWLRSHVSRGNSIIAPAEFAEVLPNQVLIYDAIADEQPTDASWIVIHKGMVDTLPLSLFGKVMTAWNPVYASPVFVVFTTQLEVKAIAANDADLQALHQAYQALKNPGKPAS